MPKMNMTVSILRRTLALPRFLLLGAFPLLFASSVGAQSLLISSNSGSGVRTLETNVARTYNFGITTLGAGQNLVFTNIGVYMNRGVSATQPFFVNIYSGLGGSSGGGSIITNYSVAATNISQSGTTLFNLLLPSALSLSNGNYSIQFTTSAASGNSTSYGLRAGGLRLMNSSNSSALPTGFWVEDTNSEGTAGTNIQAAFVLADYQVTTTNVNLGNYRVGSTLTTNVTLTNNAPPGVNATNGNVTEQLSTLATASNSATVSGLTTNLLAGAATTNFTVGLSTGNVGSNSGTVSLAYTSLTNGTASSRTGGPTNIGSQAIAVSGVGYRLAQDAVSTTNVSLGRFHIGYTTNNGSLSGTLGITNIAANDGYSEGLAVADGGTSGGATVGGIPGGVIAAGANASVGVGLSGVTAVGSNTGTVTLGFQSSGAGTSGLAATNIGTQVINVTAQGYSGQAVWNIANGGSWNNFDNWDVPGGTPGIDGVLSTNDTATFGNAISAAQTVNLNGQSPVLTTMTFSNPSASYTVAEGTGGAITIGTDLGNGLITNAAGSHAVSAGVALAQATTAGVAADSALSLRGVVSGSAGLTKTGAGTLLLTGANTYTGTTAVSSGVVRAQNAAAFGTGLVTQADGTSKIIIDTTGTVTNAMSIYNIASLQTVTLSGNKVLNNATYDVTNNTTTTESGTLTGGGGITKLGTGTLLVTASNNFTGEVDVQAGVLDLDSSTGSAAGSTTNVIVATNATLLISQSGQVNDSATVSLSGGTITRASGVSETFGALTLTESSFLDYTTGTYGNLTFGTYTSNSKNLTLNNFFQNNSLTLGGVNLSSQIPASFSGTSFTSANGLFTINSVSGAFISFYDSGADTFTIVAIPEPSTYVTAAGLLALLLWPTRRRLLKDVKSILGLRAPIA
jgi:fibronectin-binding autotransporter adhesin